MVQGPLTDNARVRHLVATVLKHFSGSLATSGRYVAGLRRAADERPDNAQSVFEWAVGGVEQSLRQAEIGDSCWAHTVGLKETARLSWLLEDVPSDSGYLYLRYRYLAETAHFSAPKLVPLGRRLLQKRPSDDVVAAYLASQLGASKVRRDSDEALSIIERLLAKEPNRLLYIGIVGGIYEWRWTLLGQSREDALKCLQWSKKYVEVAPKGCPNSANQEVRIRVSESILAGKSG